MRSLLFLTICLAICFPARCGHTLTAREQTVLKSWLVNHPQYRLAINKDCDCEGDIQQMKTGYGGLTTPVPGYHPYVATGDFNGDGVRDFAVVVIDREKKEKNFTLVVFNGPFRPGTTSPAFIESGLDLKRSGLVFGPPRPKPYRLVLGPFESDSGVSLAPQGRSYRLEHPEDE